jgi:hypothetical protein
LPNLPNFPQNFEIFQDIWSSILVWYHILNYFFKLFKHGLNSRCHLMLNPSWDASQWSNSSENWKIYITTPTITSLFWGKIMQKIKIFMFHIPCFLKKILVKFPKKSHFQFKVWFGSIFF